MERGLAFCRAVYHTSPTGDVVPVSGGLDAGLPDIGAAVYLGLKDKADPGEKLEGYGYDPSKAALLPQRLSDALNALEADHELSEVLGGYFTESFLAYKRNEIDRFERYVTDWEFREYAYHL
jgi:glutamine synthetase